jgi:hypothetical protein
LYYLFTLEDITAFDHVLAADVALTGELADSADLLGSSPT